MEIVTQKHFLVYKITNRINGKTYIGCHRTNNVGDKYMGSGKYLKRAQAKYGLGNFEKTILFDFDNESEMLEKEIELISLLRPEYNLHEGGSGGWDYINSLQKNNEFRSLGGKARKGISRPTPAIQTKESRAKARATLVDGFRSGRIKPSFTGRKHSEETKLKMSLAKKNKIK